MPITDRQKKELNVAILEYLKDHGYNNTLESFQKECSLELPTDNLKSLERKWTAVVRLTKKVQDLESRLEETENELKEAKPFAYQDPKSKQHKLFDDILPNNTMHNLKGHHKGINKILFHPTYSWIVSAGDGAIIGVWDYETGKNEKWIRGHTNGIYDLTFNNNGTLLASCSSDMSIRIWNFEDDFRCIKTLNGHDHAVTGVEFCRHNNDILLSCSRDGTVKFWDVQSGFCTDTINDIHDGEWVKKIIVSFDGSLFATCSVDQTVRVLDMKSKNEIQCLKGHEHVVECISFSHPHVDAIISGKPISSKTTNGTHNNGSVETKRDDDDDDDDNLGSYNNYGSAAPMYIASGSRDKNIIIWSIKSGVPMMTLKGHENWVRGILFHPCGRFLLSCADDRSVRVWDLAHAREKETNIIKEAHKFFVSCIDWNPAHSLLASGSSGKELKIWNYDPKKF